jgi:hypothetical protein
MPDNENCFSPAPRRTLEQGQVDWRQAPTATKTRLVDPDPIERPTSHRCTGFTSRRATNLVALRADRSLTTQHTTMLRCKPIAATASVHEPQARIRG